MKRPRTQIFTQPDRAAALFASRLATSPASDVPMQLKGVIFGALALFAAAPMALSAASAPAAPRRPLALQDQTGSNPSFAQFRTRLQQAVRDRDAAYLKGILPSGGISIGNSRPTSINQLNLGDRNARLWKVLDYTLAHSCGQSSVPNGREWICPTVARDFNRSYPAPGNQNELTYLASQVIIVGTDVNVRSQPNTTSAIVGKASNEVLRSNPKAQGSFSINDPRAGWAGVILPNGKVGYVSRRFAYFPLGYHLQVSPTSQGWKLTQVLAGE
jgi:hypothetical protein